MRGLVSSFLLLSVLGGPIAAGPVDEIPSPFLPLEPMIGSWKGAATPTANRIKGWQESHAWAWKFENGRPAGMSLTIEGGKTLAKGQLTFDAATGKYQLDGTDPQGKPVRFLGRLGPDGRTLTLDRVVPPTDARERLIIRPNSNKIRYNLLFDRQEPGAPQFKNVITVGLTKDGENFAAGGASSNLPRCIMTGGASTLTVSYQGKSYPVCCTGCRDEFNENPEKYAKLAEKAARTSSAKENPAEKSAPKGKDDGSFDGLVEESKPKAEPMPTRAASETRAKAAPSTSTSPKDAKAKDDPESKAGRELRLGQNFEKQGKASLALDHYRKVVKDHPGTEAARAATARIKAIKPR